ncbi:ketoreductase domain-containing protein, partial [Streptomyces rameus]|uniref:ketoreductase domain-containing protein n=1 Tax=Streptomyces rameus TaxID=68261 RepID=UPI0031EF9396
TAELVRRGARHLLLIGRRAVSELGDEARAFLGRHADDGVRAVYRGGGCDTAKALADACTALAGMPPVRGVVHAAGTLTRTPAAGLTADGYAAELRGKAAGAWWLHRASAGWPLDFFVLVSSVSALWGTEGCAAYSAANGMLDALAAHRTSLGLPAASLGFGPWALTGAGSGGMADGELLERSARLGVGSFDAATGRAALTTTAPGPEGHLVVCPLDLERLRTVMSGLRPRGVFGGEPAPAARAPREPSAAARLLALPEDV